MSIADDLARIQEAYARTESDLDPPLGWDAVEEFEQRNGVVLPEPYRSFVATVSDGTPLGPPDQGLLCLGETPFGWPASPPAALARPFPLTTAWTWAGDRPPPAPGVTADAVRDGVLPLGDDGCAMYWVLVVTGAHRGHVWQLTEAGAQPFGREFGYTSGESGFRGWVEHRFDRYDWWDAR